MTDTAAPTADVRGTVLRDDDGDFARRYCTAGTSVHVVRPDGYLGRSTHGVDAAALTAHLGNTFA